MPNVVVLWGRYILLIEKSRLFWHCREKARCTLAEWQNMVERADYYLLRGEGDQICDTGYRFLGFARAASLDAIAHNTLHWHATPKQHASGLCYVSVSGGVPCPALVV